jgi:hypothetical protein
MRKVVMRLRGCGEPIEPGHLDVEQDTAGPGLRVASTSWLPRSTCIATSYKLLPKIALRLTQVVSPSLGSPPPPELSRRGSPLELSGETSLDWRSGRPLLWLHSN